MNDRSSEEPALTIDALGQLCPLPVIELAKRIGDVPVGAIVALVSDDPAAAADIPAWCRMRAHEFLGTSASAYLIRRTH